MIAIKGQAQLIKVHYAIQLSNWKYEFPFTVLIISPLPGKAIVNEKIFGNVKPNIDVVVCSVDSSTVFKCSGTRSNATSYRKGWIQSFVQVVLIF